jgi:hypothetical protein
MPDGEHHHHRIKNKSTTANGFTVMTTALKPASLGYKSADQQMPPSTISWLASAELGYSLFHEQVSATAPDQRITRKYPRCSYCKKAGAAEDGGGSASLKECGRCRSVAYCSRECQVLDWKQRHKRLCDSYRQLTEDTLGHLSLLETTDRDAIRTGIFSKIRMYACPYSVHQGRALGKGFLFVQSTVTLALMSLGMPVHLNGEPMTERRSIILHFLTLGEFDVEVCREDFELATLRPQLRHAVETYDPEKEVVLLARFRCGHLAVGVTSLVPEYSVCERLGQEYFGERGTDPLQLDIDDC